MLFTMSKSIQCVHKTMRIYNGAIYVHIAMLFYTVVYFKTFYYYI